MDATQGAPAGQKRSARVRGSRSCCWSPRSWSMWRSWAAGAARPSGTEGPAIGRRLPYFRLEPLTGDSRSVSLDDLPGRVTAGELLGHVVSSLRPRVSRDRRAGRKVRQARRLPALRRLLRRLGQRRRSRRAGRRDEAVPAIERRHAADLRRPECRQPPGDDRASTWTGGGMAYPTTLVLDRSATIRGFWQGYDPRAAAKWPRSSRTCCKNRVGGSQIAH